MGEHCIQKGSSLLLCAFLITSILFINAVVASSSETTSAEPTLVKQWSYEFGKICYRMVFGPSPAVADLGYGDQNLEIITGNDEWFPIPYTSGRWFAFDAGGNVLWTLDTLNDESRSSVAIADVDQDGDLELVGGTTSGWRLQLFNHSGEMLWARSIPYFVHSSPAVADLRPDLEGLEMVAGTYGGRVFSFDAAGNHLWTYHTGDSPQWWHNGWVISSPAVGDVNADGALEVVVSSSDTCWFGWWSFHVDWLDDPTLHVLNGKTGAAKWTHEFTGAYGVVSSAALANLDHDGKLDIVVGSDDGKVYALDAEGNLKWSYATGGAVWSSPALANRGTGGLDVYVGSEDTHLYLIEGESGTLIDRFCTDEPIRSSPVVADIDGDQKLEVLFIGWRRNSRYSGWWYSLDLYSSGDHLWALEDTGSQVTQHSIEWGMFRRDERRTGLYPSSSPAQELTPVSPGTSVDIAPNTLNFKSRGKWITAYIELADGWEVNDIDLASIRLNGTLPITGPSEVGDEDRDGIPDLMVKFDRQELIGMLKGTVETPGEVELRVSGEVMLEPDAFPFEVSTFSFEAGENVRVIDPGRGG